MTSPLSDVLEDLAGQVGPADLAPGLAARAWARGRRRQIRARVSRTSVGHPSPHRRRRACGPAGPLRATPASRHKPGIARAGYLTDPQALHIVDLPAHGAP